MREYFLVFMYTVFILKSANCDTIDRCLNEQPKDEFQIETNKQVCSADGMGRLDESKNLTRISWAHAVNSQTLLNETLDNDDIDMIEADVVIGRLVDDNESDIPVMGHPPTNVSDLSLDSFLHQINAFNVNADKIKGIKLDFKSIEAFTASVDKIKAYENVDYSIWINADILPGPLNATTVPVNATMFLKKSKEINNATILSIGWTTNYGFLISKAEYTKEQIDDMLNTITANNVTNPVTYPVRAGIAAQSVQNVLRLLNVEGSTLTIWSSAGDYVDVESLRKLIFTAGLDRVYVDVPDDLKQQLHLDQPPDIN